VVWRHPFFIQLWTPNRRAAAALCWLFNAGFMQHFDNASTEWATASHYGLHKNPSPLMSDPI